MYVHMYICSSTCVCYLSQPQLYAVLIPQVALSPVDYQDAGAALSKSD